MNYQKEGFNLLTSRRPKYLLRLLKSYPKIIYTDIDTIWKGDPRPYFKGSLDFWAQIDGLTNGKPYFKGYIPFICTGFLAFRSTTTSLHLLQKWHHELAKDPKKEQDQNIFQRIIFESSANYGVLPIKYFSNGRTYFEEMSHEVQKGVVLVHNNFISGKDHKIDRFRKFNLWFPNICLNNQLPFERYTSKHEKIHQRKCHVDDRSISLKTTVFPGKVFISEYNLKKAFMARQNYFKVDHMYYFFDALEHWKV